MRNSQIDGRNYCSPVIMRSYFGWLVCSAPSPRLFDYPFGFPDHIVGACCCVVLRTLGFEPFVVHLDHTLDERLQLVVSLYQPSQLVGWKALLATFVSYLAANLFQHARGIGC